MFLHCTERRKFSVFWGFVIDLCTKGNSPPCEWITIVRGFIAHKQWLSSSTSSDSFWRSTARFVKLCAMQMYSTALGHISCGKPAFNRIDLDPSLMDLIPHSNLELWKSSWGIPGSGSHPRYFTASTNSPAASDFTQHNAFPWARVPPNVWSAAMLLSVVRLVCGKAWQLPLYAS